MGWRRRWWLLDRVVRAAVRFDEVNAQRLAAAITYYAFLATFPLLLLAFALLGVFLNDNALLTLQVEQFLDQNVPGLPVGTIVRSSNAAWIVGVAGFLFAGLGWVDAIRSSVRAVWHRNEFPGNYFIRKLWDALTLTVLGVMMAASIGLSVLLSSGAEWVLDVTSLADSGVGKGTLRVGGFLIGLLINTVLFVNFLAVLPRLRMPFHRMFYPALVGSVGMELLKTVGGIYIRATEENPAYRVVAGTIGLLVFLYLFDQLLLFCAAITATGAASDQVVDRAEQAAKPADRGRPAAE